MGKSEKLKNLKLELDQTRLLMKEILDRNGLDHTDILQLPHAEFERWNNLRSQSISISDEFIRLLKE